MPRIRILALAALVMLSGCGGGAVRPSSNPNQISREELAGDAVVSLSVLDAIQRLRPGWMRPRAPSSINSSAGVYPAVVLNNVVSNDLNVLGTIPVSDAELVRYVDSRDATTRFGTGYVNGVIEVVTRRGGR